MSKDPLEAERNFRQRIERSAEARRQSRRSRQWLRAFALPFKLPWLTLLLVVLVALGSFLIFIFGVWTKWTDAYACSLDEARRSPVVIAELGEPIEAGFFAWGNWEKLGMMTQASFHTTLEGPKGKGTLRVQLYSSPIGSSLRMELEKHGRSQQVYDGPTPCR